MKTKLIFRKLTYFLYPFPLSILFVFMLMITTSTPSNITAATIRLNKTKATVSVGKSVTLKLKGTTQKPKWSSSNKKIATVNNKGIVSSKRAGVVTITATLKNKKYRCTITTIPTPEQVYEDIIAMKASYPEGMTWTNDNYYEWNGDIYTGGYGCVAFAFAMSDAAFGNLPSRQHTDFSNIKVGDIIRINNDTHSVIVLKIDGDDLTIAEGNFNSSIHWERIINRADTSNWNFVLTRYPQ